MEQEEFTFQIKGKAMVVIDWANIRNQQKTLGWNIDLEKLYQWLRSHKEIEKIQFFYGYENNEASRRFLKKVESFGYKVITKEVKYLNVFLSESKFREKAERIERLIKDLGWPVATATVEMEDGREIEDSQIIDETAMYALEQELFTIVKEPLRISKCDFDVEITTEIMKKFEEIQTIILFSGDGDFAYPLNECLQHWKKTYVVSHADFIGKEIWKFKEENPKLYPCIIKLEKMKFLQKIPRQPKLTG